MPILKPGHPSLLVIAAPVQWPDPDLENQLAGLHATLADFQARMGFGRAMAAPQVGISKRMVVLHLGAAPFALINPEITWRSEAVFAGWDDCLSVPDCIVRVQRHASISIRYKDERGRVRNWLRLPCDMAESLQHELDHLDGILMTERAHGQQAIRPIADHVALIGAARPQHRLSLANVVRSASAIAPEFLNSPQYNCEPLSQALGCEITLKIETANPIRSFKGRGASFCIGEMHRLGDARPLVCASAGNWGQAVAYACRSFGRPLVVYASLHANPLKVERMKALGAEVRQIGEDFDEAKNAAQAHALETGSLMLEDGLEASVSEGHGTIAMELLARGAAYDAVVIPLGNGGLLNGMARWFKAASPATRVIGVCAAGADSMAQSWRSNRVIQTSAAQTIADGIAVRVPILEAVQDMQGLVDEVLLVTDTQIVQAMQLTLHHAGLLLEPSGAAGLAAIVAHPALFSGQQIATVLCGGNITQADREQYLHRGR